MSILINKNTRVITQGMTGKVGQFHTLHFKLRSALSHMFLATENKGASCSSSRAQSCTHSTPSISTSAPCGNAATPTAARAGYG